VAYRETLTRANPEPMVLGGSDHFHQLFYDNMPQFLVGKAPYCDANYYNEELSAHLLRAGLDAGFDFAFSNALRVDHSITEQWPESPCFQAGDELPSPLPVMCRSGRIEQHERADGAQDLEIQTQAHA
jgi:hypothetical protein